MVFNDGALGARYAGGFARRGRPSFRGFGSFGWDPGQQQTWCQQNYGADPNQMSKCMDNGFPKSLTPPWTAAGKEMRGLTDPIGAIMQVVGSGGGGGGGTAPANPGTSPQKAGGGGGGGAAGPAAIMGIPKNIALVGGGLLAAGAVLLVLKKGRR